MIDFGFVCRISFIYKKDKQSYSTDATERSPMNHLPAGAMLSPPAILPFFKFECGSDNLESV
jgi:hypothetical protein